MKIRIKPYLRTLIKENIVYFLVNMLLFVVALVFLLYNIDEIPKRQATIDQLDKEISDLKNKAKLTELKGSSSDEELQNYSILLNNLVPNSEDYFSIIYALEKLSQDTGFVISNYTINLEASTGQKTKLKIDGKGNKDAFLKFLEKYNYGGGRYITSDKISLANQFSEGLSLDITLYNQNIPINEELTGRKPNPALIQEVKKIMDKVDFTLKDNTTDTKESYDYPKKTNPF
jgi:hypothetical protein